MVIEFDNLILVTCLFFTKGDPFDCFVQWRPWKLLKIGSKLHITKCTAKHFELGAVDKPPALNMTSRCFIVSLSCRQQRRYASLNVICSILAVITPCSTKHLTIYFQQLLPNAEHLLEFLCFFNQVDTVKCSAHPKCVRTLPRKTEVENSCSQSE